MNYVGVVAVPARPGKAAAITLSAAYTPGARVSNVRPLVTAGATGTIQTQNGSTSTLSGTFDSTAGVFAVNGGGYQINATASAGSLTGSGTQASEGGLPLATVGTATSSLPTQTWVGTARSNTGQNCGNSVPTLSQFQFVLQSTVSGGTGTWILTGHFVNDTDATQGTFKGSAQYDGAGSLSFTTDAPHTGSGTGSFNGSVWSGTYQGGSPGICEFGTWQTTRIQ